MFKVNNEDTRTPCSSVSFVNFEQMNTGQESCDEGSFNPLMPGGKKKVTHT